MWLIQVTQASLTKDPRYYDIFSRKLGHIYQGSTYINVKWLRWAAFFLCVFWASVENLRYIPWAHLCQGPQQFTWGDTKHQHLLKMLLHTYNLQVASPPDGTIAIVHTLNVKQRRVAFFFPLGSSVKGRKSKSSPSPAIMPTLAREGEAHHFLWEWRRQHTHLGSCQQQVLR